MKSLDVLVGLTVAVVYLAFALTSGQFQKKQNAREFMTPNISRYQFVNESLTWPEAHKFCQSLGGHLAMPKSDAEATVLFEFMSNNSATRVHIGFHGKFTPGMLVTVLDQPLDQIGYRRMSPNETSSSKFRCGSLVAGVGLETISCDDALPSVCQLYLTEGYRPIQGYGYYKFYGYEETMIWADAMSKCFADGAYLLVINSELEYNALFDIYSHCIGRTISYGAHQKYANQEFETIFGDGLNATGFDVWSAVQPNDTSSLCYPTFSIFMSSSFYLRGLLLDTDFYPRPFICKKSFH